MFWGRESHSYAFFTPISLGIAIRKLRGRGRLTRCTLCVFAVSLWEQKTDVFFMIGKAPTILCRGSILAVSYFPAAPLGSFWMTSLQELSDHLDAVRTARPCAAPWQALPWPRLCCASDSPRGGHMQRCCISLIIIAPVFFYFCSCQSSSFFPMKIALMGG